MRCDRMAQSCNLGFVRSKITAGNEIIIIQPFLADNLSNLCVCVCCVRVDFSRAFPRSPHKCTLYTQFTLQRTLHFTSTNPLDARLPFTPSEQQR